MKYEVESVDWYIKIMERGKDTRTILREYHKTNKDLET